MKVTAIQTVCFSDSYHAKTDFKKKKKKIIAKGVSPLDTSPWNNRTGWLGVKH